MRPILLLYVQDALDIESSNVIYVKGCLEKGEEWFQQYMIPVAGAIAGIAVILVRLVVVVCHSLIHSFIHSFTHSFIHSFIHSLIHSFMYSLMYCLIITDSYLK